MRSLEPLCLACATCFAMAPASLNVSKKLRSLSETRRPLPVTPFCRDSHSWSVKSVFVAMTLPPLKKSIGVRRFPIQRTLQHRDHSATPTPAAVTSAGAQRYFRLLREAFPADAEGVPSMALDAQARAVRRCGRSVDGLDVRTERVALVLGPDGFLAIPRYLGKPAAAWTGDHATKFLPRSYRRYH